MVLLHISADLQARLERIDSPIAKAILAMSTIDDTRKDYINYLGISRDDVTKISYLDRNKEKKNSIKHPKNFRYHSNNGDSTVSINKRFFRKIFWRGRWIKNPHFVDVNLRPHMTCKERRSWYKKKFSFVHSIYDYGEQFYKNRSYLQLLRKDEHNQRYYLGDMKVDTMKWQQSYIRSQYRYECEYKNTEDWGSVYMYKSMLKNSPLKFHWNTFTEWHDRLWNPDHRLHGSAAKIAKRVLGKAFKYSDKQLEDFADQFRKQGMREVDGLSGNYIFEEYEGEQIREGYLYSNYYEESNSLGGSCMRYTKCQPFLQIYVDNTNTCSLAVLLKNDSVAARCLLWYPNGKSDQTDVLFDRIYSYNAESEEALRIYLERKGYYDIHNNNEGSNFDLHLVHDHKHYAKFPYMDTFRYIKGKRLSNYSDSGYDYELDCPDGYHTDDRCPACCGEMDEDTDRFIDRRGSSYNQQYVCEDCAVYSQDYDAYIYYNDAVETHDCEWILKTDAVQCEDNKWEYKDRAIKLHDGDYVTSEVDVVQDTDGDYYRLDDVDDYCVYYSGKYYHFNHYRVVQVGEEYYHEDDDRIVYVSNEGEYYLRDSRDIIEIDGEYYLKSDEDVVYIDYDDTYYLKSDSSLQEVNGAYYHVDDPQLEELLSESEDDAEVVL